MDEELARERCYVRCKISLGFFDDEFYVILADFTSTLVNRKNVQFEDVPSGSAEVDGQVQVYMIEYPTEGNEVLIELPGEPVVGGLRAWIPKSLIIGQ